MSGSHPAVPHEAGDESPADDDGIDVIGFCLRPRPPRDGLVEEDVVRAPPPPEDPLRAWQRRHGPHPHGG